MKALLLAVLLAAPCLAGTRIIKAHHPWDTDLFRVHNRIGGLSATFQTTGPVDVTTSGHVNLVHRGIVVGPVGWSLWIQYRYATTLEGLAAAPWWRIKGCKPSGNIASVEEHYKDASLDGYVRFDTPGWYELSVWGSSHSSSAPYTDGLIEVNPETGSTWPSNQLIVRVEDVP